MRVSNHLEVYSTMTFRKSSFAWSFCLSLFCSCSNDSPATPSAPLPDAGTTSVDSGAVVLDASNDAGAATPAGDANIAQGLDATSTSSRQDASAADGALPSATPDAATPPAATPDAAAPPDAAPPVASCGAIGQACCGAGATCNANLSCLDQTSCSCVKSLQARYTLRVDGAVLQADGATPVLDANTGLPLKGMVSVSDGRHHGCALDGAGAVWCWPTDAMGNATGQLGNGTTTPAGATYRATAVLTQPNTKLADVSSLGIETFAYYGAVDASCAVLTNGQLHCWGNLSWLLNNGTALTSSFAQPVTSDGLSPLTGVQHVAAGAGESACALLQGSAANEVWCWGKNTTYNLGLGDMVSHQYPSKVLGLAAPTKVILAASLSGGDGRRTSCAIDGGEVRCWGSNNRGAAGVNTSDAYVKVPTLVRLQSGTVLDHIVDLQASGNETGYSGDGPNFCALRDDHTVWCWGDSFSLYAENYGATNVTSLGYSPKLPRYLTSDGVYHLGSQMTQPVNCGDLQ